jgi:hypothetical protein
MLTEGTEFAMANWNDQPYFADFSRLARETVSAIPASRRPLIVLTGGLRSVSQMERALSSSQCDLVGLGRPSVLCPHFPRIARDKGEVFLPEPPRLAKPAWYPTLFGAGIRTVWYNIAMHRIATKRPMQEGLGSLGVILLSFSRTWTALYLTIIPIIIVPLAVLVYTYMFLHS